MIDKHTFENFIKILESYECGLSELETTLNVTFDNNFLTHTVDKMIDTLSESFFTQEQLKDIDYVCQIETVKDLLYHYCFTAEFGLLTDRLKGLYIENEGKADERKFDCLTEEQLYDIIVRYVNPENTFNITINC